MSIIHSNCIIAQISKNAYLSRSLVVVLLCLGCKSVYADSCWISSPTLNFGSVNTQQVSSKTDLDVTCNQYNNVKTSFNLCFYIEDNSPSGINPRHLISLSWPFDYLNYDLYYDPSFSRMIDNKAAPNNLLCKSLQIENNGQQTVQIPIYGKVYANQNVKADNYQSYNMTVKLLYKSKTGDVVPSVEETLAQQNMVQNYMKTTTKFENSCAVVGVNTLDFGSIISLNQPIYGQTSIQLKCPTNTALKVGLDTGLYASGTQRRMTNAGQFIQYDLYQDSAYSIPWGTSDNSVLKLDTYQPVFTIPVYGRILPQNQNLKAGEYRDTITIKLTY